MLVLRNWELLLIRQLNMANHFTRPVPAQAGTQVDLPAYNPKGCAGRGPVNFIPRR